MEERFSMTQQGVTKSNGDNNAGAIEKRSSVTRIVTESIYRDNQMRVTDNITRLAHKGDILFLSQKNTIKIFVPPKLSFRTCLQSFKHLYLDTPISKTYTTKMQNIIKIKYPTSQHYTIQVHNPSKYSSFNNKHFKVNSFSITTKHPYTVCRVK